MADDTFRLTSPFFGALDGLGKKPPAPAPKPKAPVPGTAADFMAKAGITPRPAPKASRGRRGQVRRPGYVTDTGQTQKALVDSGYLAPTQVRSSDGATISSVDGVWGRDTERAWREYLADREKSKAMAQKAKGLPVPDWATGRGETVSLTPNSSGSVAQGLTEGQQLAQAAPTSRLLAGQPRTEAVKAGSERLVDMVKMIGNPGYANEVLNPAMKGLSPEDKQVADTLNAVAGLASNFIPGVGQVQGAAQGALVVDNLGRRVEAGANPLQAAFEEGKAQAEAVNPVPEMFGGAAIPMHERAARGLGAAMLALGAKHGAAKAKSVLGAAVRGDNAARSWIVKEIKSSPEATAAFEEYAWAKIDDFDAPAVLGPDSPQKSAQASGRSQPEQSSVERAVLESGMGEYQAKAAAAGLNPVIEFNRAQGKEPIYNAVEEAGGPGKLNQSDVPKLVAVHNTGYAGARAASELGGIPHPSVAVVPKDVPFEDFGPVSFVAKRNVVDPKADHRNNIFSSDVYSQRQPRPQYKIDARGLAAKLAQHSQSTGERSFTDPYNVKRFSGNKDKVVKDLRDDDAVRAAHLKEIGVPYGGAAGTIRDAIVTARRTVPHYHESLDAFIEREFSQFFHSPTVKVRGKNVAYTVANVSAAMGSNIKARESTMTASLGKQRAKSAKKFESVDAARASYESVVGPEKFAEFKESQDALWNKYTEATATSEHKDFSSRWDLLDRMSDAIGEESKRTPSASSLGSRLRRMGLDPTPEQVQAGVEIARGIKHGPTQYFESKPTRPVMNQEWAGVVVPKDTAPEVVQRLRDTGVTDIRTYDPAIKGDRWRVVQSFEDVPGALFQKGKAGVKGAFDPATRVIELAKGKADFSTVVHETAHSFHDALQDHPEYGPVITKVYGRLEPGKRAEQFASHFEEYLRSGKSPVPAMKSVFSAIREWMTAIYKRWTGGKASPEVKEIFDRVYSRVSPETLRLVKEFEAMSKPVETSVPLNSPVKADAPVAPAPKVAPAHVAKADVPGSVKDAASSTVEEAGAPMAPVRTDALPSSGPFVEPQRRTVKPEDLKVNPRLQYKRARKPDVKLKRGEVLYDVETRRLVPPATTDGPPSTSKLDEFRASNEARLAELESGRKSRIQNAKDKRRGAVDIGPEDFEYVARKAVKVALDTGERVYDVLRRISAEERFTKSETEKARLVVDRLDDEGGFGLRARDQARPPEPDHDMDGATGLARQVSGPMHERLGTEPAAPQGTSVKGLASEADALVKSGRIDPRKLAFDVAEGKEGPSPVNAAVLEHHLRDVANKYDAAKADLDAGVPGASERYFAGQADLNQIEKAVQRHRKEFHALGQALKIARRDDFSLVGLRRAARAANLGEDLSPDAHAKIEALHRKMADAEAELESVRGQLADRIKEDARREARARRGNATDAGPTATTAAMRQRKSALGVLKRMGLAVDADVLETGGFRTKKAGAVAVPEGEEAKFAKAVNSIVNSFVRDGSAHSLDDVLDLVKKAVPGLDDHQILSAMSGKYRAVLTSADVAKIAARRHISEMKKAAEYRQKTRAQRAGYVATKMLTSLPRALQATGDVSAPFIQGLPILLTHPKAWAKAWVPQTVALLKKGGVDELRAVRSRDPAYAESVAHGVDYTDMDSAFSHSEEFAVGKLLEHVGLTGKKGGLVKELSVRFDGAFQEFLNSARLSMYKEHMRHAPKDPKERAQYARDIALMVNTFSGRGSTKLSRVVSGEVGGALLYSPRLLTSSIEAMAFTPFIGAKTGLAKRRILAKYAQGVAAGATVLLTAKAFGWDIEEDPRSTDFLRMTSPDGKVQIAVFDRVAWPFKTLVQGTFGNVSRKGNYTGPGEYGMRSLVGMLEGKASPAVRLAGTLTTAGGKVWDDDEGKYVEVGAKGLLKDSFVPLSWKDVAKAADETRPMSARLAAPLSLTGIGVKKPAEKKASRPPPPVGWPVALKSIIDRTGPELRGEPPPSKKPKEKKASMSRPRRAPGL